MPYIDGFVLPVPAGNREKYRRMAAEVAPVFLEHGALRLVECWGDDVPHGEMTDLHAAVKAKEGEAIVFSWVLWPSREARDAGNAAIQADPRMQRPADNDIFDPRRMIFGGFEVLLDTETNGG